MSSFDILGIGVQALQANQTALSAVSQNISNVNTPGYSRQTANFVTRPGQSGVYINDISRVADQLLTEQMWSDTANYNRHDVYTDMISQLDDLIAAKSTSVSTAMDNFFGALQNAVDDPTSLPNRQLFVAESEALVRRFNDLYSFVNRQTESVEEKLKSSSENVTALATGIADVNLKIRQATSAGEPANELRDQRDDLIEQLSQYTNVTTVKQNNDEYAVFIGNGQPLVVGVSANEMVTMQGSPDPTQLGVGLRIGGKDYDVTSELSGGALGGLISYRSEQLNSALNEIGRIAISFAQTMNDQHQRGMDINGELGGLLFKDVNSNDAAAGRVSASVHNVLEMDTARVDIIDLENLSRTDYTLTFDTDSRVSLRTSENQLIQMTSLTRVTDPADVTDGSYYADFNAGELKIGIGGVAITLDAGQRFVAGDSYLIKPTRSGAEQIDMVITNGKQLALASPIRVLPDSDNHGTGLATVEVTDIGDPAFSTQAGALTPPVEIVFNNNGTYTVFDLSTDPLRPIDQGFGPLDNQPFTAGKPIVLNGFEVTIVNQPEAGDRFTFEYNTDGVSDNRNALALSNLQLAHTVDGGTYQDIYSRLVEEVGTSTTVSMISRDSGKAVMDSTADAKAGVSGVNMDEEAAKLLQFQQAYQASAQLFRAAQTLFDSLLNSL